MPRLNDYIHDEWPLEPDLDKVNYCGRARIKACHIRALFYIFNDIL